MTTHSTLITGKQSTSLVKYLEILPTDEIKSPATPPSLPLDQLAIERLTQVNVPYYRTLYDGVGDQWLWLDRRVMPDDVLEKIITASDLSIHVLRVAGVDAGYFELEWKANSAGVVENVEVSYFGLMPAFVGKRIGPWFLNECLTLIRRTEPQARIWVHTCSWDHPKAYATYVSAGFKYYKEEVEPITVPDGFVPHIPYTAAKSESN